MEVLVRNAEGNVGTKDREYAAKKLGRLDRYFNSASKVEMVHREEKLGHRIEITVFADGLFFRGEEFDSSIRAAIDKVSDKMETRLERFKGRLQRRHKARGIKSPEAFEELPLPEEASDNHHLEISERKTFLLKPMSREEASIQMEMLDHPFFVFRSEETGQFEVLYKRKDGRYGLLQPEA
jgi:putative sigma-54 modulation protein